MEKAKAEKKERDLYRLIYSEEHKMWEIRRDSNERVTKRFATKAEAEAYLKQLSKNQETAYIKHKKDGKFQKK